ncbi:hypothetical protein KP509_04G034700 [Ceratopteris richardii]|uniref:Uncharacterized protein n=1 Tax=Ceratopteris richardii TaxID=49495 RepID=A0A8T2URX2_CERRI|nr:hypothetical protein KP509_04G034700 [Ceratopteris richardii]
MAFRPPVVLCLLILVSGLAMSTVPVALADACPCGFPPITDPYDTNKYECCVITSSGCTLLCNKGCCP